MDADAPKPDAPPTPPAAPTPPAPKRPRLLRGLLRSLAAYLLGTAAVLALLCGAVAWLLVTPAGTAWLLAQVPGLALTAPQGSLLGGFSAQRVELPLAGDGTRLVLHDLKWSAPRLRADEGPVWLRIGLDELRARRVDVKLAEGPSQASPPPTSLALPVGLDVAALRIDELQVDGLDTPLRVLRARVGLALDAGAHHRADDLQLQWDRLHLTGRAQVATGGDLAVDASLQIAQPPGTTGEWGATLQLQGPLAAPKLQAQLRGRSEPSRPEQALDLQATLHPFAAWPLGELQAQAQGLDLAALHDAAPRTALELQASARSDGMDRPAELDLSLRNHDAGRWNEGRLPLRMLRLQLQARPDDPTRLEVQAFEAELGTRAERAGRVTGSGLWQAADWQLDARLSGLLPAQLDARAPAMRLDGRLRLDGSGFAGADRDRAAVAVRGELDGTLLGRGPQQPVQVRLDARLQALRIEVHDMIARAGAAQATFGGRLTRASRNAGWAASGRAGLHDFDPLPWWPGPEDSPWRRGPHKLNANADFDLALPAAGLEPVLQQIARVRGRADVEIEPSRLAGVPVEGRLALQTAADGSTRGQLQLQLQADGNRLRAEARLGRIDAGSDDHWDLVADLPALKKLQPIWALLYGSEARLGGKLAAEAQVDGHWPKLATRGKLQAAGLEVGLLQVERADGRWTLGSRDDAPLEAQLELTGVRRGAPSAERVALKLSGTPVAHTLAIDGESKALPPAWIEALQVAPAGTAAKRSVASLRAQGGLLGAAAGGWKGWRGKLQAAELRGDAKAAAAWLQLDPFELDLAWADGPLRLKAEPGRAVLLGAALSWSRIAWNSADGGRPAKLDADGRIETLDVAPLLARVQPAFGWGGDLRVGGHLRVQSTPAFSADIVVERTAGDLSVTDDGGTRKLGLSDLRLGLNAQDGVWSFTTGLAGTTLGRAAGALVVRTTPTTTWPHAQAPAEGVLELQIADLGVWGSWLPPGWRLAGALNLSAAMAGQFGAPELTGQLRGSGIGVRNLLQGVDVRDGELDVTLLGETARIEKFAASAGKGRLSLLGDADLGASPRAELALKLEQFQLLGRVDRRVVASGDATLKLGRDTLALKGDFRVDEGLIDFGRSEAPQLGEDVHVHRGGTAAGLELSDAEAEAARLRGRRASLDLRVDMGEQLRIRGRGLDAGLRGELRLTAPQGRLRVDGSLRTVDGTYRAYRQRLNITRGVLTFNGPVENPQLDIEAIRPNLDVRVGVAVTGTVLVPRVRLFSDTEMSDAERLSWLLRGRASEGPGSGDAALLQAAAVALLAGEETTPLDQLFDLFGLDNLSVRQGDSATGGTVVTVGKQLSQRWYVGYERGLNATTGNWQLIYRIAQRFTVRAQSGENNSIELIWSWRWN